MNISLAWNDFISPLDYTSTHRTTNTIHCWGIYKKYTIGVAFQCKTSLVKEVLFRLDVIQEDIIRARMNPEIIME